MLIQSVINPLEVKVVKKVEETPNRLHASGWRSLRSLDRLESVESVCDVSPHSSMAKPNLLTVTLGPTGEAVFSFEVAKGFSRFREARAGSAMGNVHTCGPNECVIISGESGLDK